MHSFIIQALPLLHIGYIPLLSVTQEAIHLAPPPDSLSQITSFVNAVKTTVQTLGGAIFVIGITIAGMMRMMSFGSERRIMVSNMAITAAVVGLAIMLMAGGIDAMLKNFFQ
jgi:uncharacterized membrane protein